jgi:hypothetical protein
VPIIVHGRYPRAALRALSSAGFIGPGGRNRRLTQKLRVDELIRKQRIVSIVELRPRFHGTGGGIDLAVIAATRLVASILTLARLWANTSRGVPAFSSGGAFGRPLSERQRDAHCGFAYFVGEHAILDRARQHHTANT